jgi:hypothetical protein
MVGILANNAAYGNAAALAEGMRKITDTVVYFRRDDPKGFHKQTESVKKVPDCDMYVVMGAISLGLLPKKKRKACLVLTDSTYMDNPAKYNRMIQVNKWKVFAMPDLAPLCGTKNIYYQPFIMPAVDKIKTELICHSPYNDAKAKQKGTTLIAAVCAKNNLPLTVIKGLSWQETIKLKARYLICIDQLFRGIGKSGLEAILLDCVVMTGEKPRGDNLPPVVWTDKNRLSDDLVELIFNRDKREEVIYNQSTWAAKNLNPEYMAGKIYEVLCG